MSGNYYPPFSLRISENLLDKIKYLASINKRSANKEIEFILEQHIRRYEAEYGVIPTSQNQD
ncbi:MAG: Arc family DNA-binding protein [Acutalibacteraceae bacterium]